MNHIGLFEGIGGFSLAARWMGWDTIAWCEINPFCQKVLSYHFPEAKQHGDITKTDFTIYRGRCDIFTGGFPCQPFSAAGKRKGTADDRHLWPEMLRAIREISPGYVVGENVRGLTNWDGGVVFDQVQADMEAEGYEVLPFLLPACAVNAPHRRDRVWFVAHSRSQQFQERTQDGISENRAEDGARMDNRAERSGNIKDVANHGNQGLQGRKINRSITGIGQNRNEQLAGLLPSNWENFPTQSPLCSRNDGLSGELVGITFPKHRAESINAYGNSIVPQVAFQIFKAISVYMEKP